MVACDIRAVVFDMIEWRVSAQVYIQPGGAGANKAKDREEHKHDR